MHILPPIYLCLKLAYDVLIGAVVKFVVDQLALESETADNERWDELLSRPESLQLLEQWGAQALADDATGLTEEFDPDKLYGFLKR